MDRLKAQRAAALKAAQDIINGAKAASRDLSADERQTVEAKFAEINDLDGKITEALKSAGLIAQLDSLSEGVDGGDQDMDRGSRAKSIGEHFMKELNGRSVKAAARGNWSTSEFKAAADTLNVGQGGLGNDGYGPLVTDVDRSFVMPYQRPLVIADLLAPGNVGGNAISYPVFGALEGQTGFVGEGGHKPQLSHTKPTWRTDALGEVAGFFKLTDDMAEDVPYVVSEIETTARYDLLLREEGALLQGDGQQPNIEGILNRSGIQDSGLEVGDTEPDAIFKAITKVQTGSGFIADGIGINPIDYQRIRLMKDGNDQYYGGGFFTGQYGAGGIMVNPPLWGLRTVVTAAVPVGHPIVAAWRTAKVFRKGGLRVESTNSNVDDFENDKITIRLRERLGLQVKYPAAFVSVDLVTPPV